MARPFTPNYHALWHIQTIGPVGEWHVVTLRSIAEATNLSRQQARNIVAVLVKLGFIEHQPSEHNALSGQMRVIRPIAHKPEHPRPAPKSSPKSRKRLVRYAGWEPQADQGW
jgi:hypothetical protein